MNQRRKVISIVVTAAVLLLAAGCQYNGATSIEPQGSARAAQKLEAFKRKLKAQREAAAKLEQGVTFPDESSPAYAARTQNRFVVNNRPTNPVAPMSLYGSLPQTTPGPASPLDSPDNISRVTFTREGADFDPDVDPTGQWLVYASTQHRETADLYLKRIDGTTVTQLTSDPANDMMPAFSPDGKTIAFCSDRSGNWDIYLMDVNGGQPVQLTSEPTHDVHPSFSPDGKQLVYCTFGARSGQWELVVIDIDNPSTKRFVATGLNPNWSPTDNRILFQRARQRGTRWFSIWTIELENGEGVRPTEIAASSNAAVITPDWSPDGKRIVFCTVIDPQADNTISGDLSAGRGGPAQADVWVVGADGRNRTNLTSSRFVNLQPVWAPDGSILFVSNRAQGGMENIWRIRPDRALRVVDRSDRANLPDAAERPAAEATDAAAMVPTE